jgi:pantoate--beta-alanine ligase
MPEVIGEIVPLRARLSEMRASGASIGLVPTMGALHAGHEALLETARRANDLVVATIFVNPLQFDRSEDLAKYPRTLEADLLVCDRSGVDLVFAPAPSELYAHEQLTFIETPALSSTLCGHFRPGHFRGVATVVLKLLNIVQPARAYFGEKDAQQLALIRRMVCDLNVPVEVVPVPTVREPDSLALSSRNKHLTPAQRAVAPVLSRALQAAVRHIEEGERSVSVIRNRALALFAPYPDARVEYFELANPETLALLDRVTGPVLVAGAIWLGTTRLIDNLSWSPAAGSKL